MLCRGSFHTPALSSKRVYQVLCERCLGGILLFKWPRKVSGNQCFTSLSIPKKHVFTTVLPNTKKIKGKRKLSKSRRRKSYEETQTRTPKSQVGAPVRRGRPTLGCPISCLLPSAPISLPCCFFPAIIPPHFLPHTHPSCEGTSRPYTPTLSRGDLPLLPST